MIEAYNNLIKGLEAIPVIFTAYSGESEDIQKLIIDIQNSIRNGR